MLKKRVKSSREAYRHNQPGENIFSGSRLLNDIDAYLKSEDLPIRDLSQVAWGCWKLKLGDSVTWDRISRYSMRFLRDSPVDSALILFSLSNVVRGDPHILSPPVRDQLLEALKHPAEKPEWMANLELRDASQFSYAISCMYPKSSVVVPFVKRCSAALKSLPVSPNEEQIPKLESCKEICLLWSVARERKAYAHSRVSKEFVSALLEASRGLRHCRDFNQNKAAQVADTISELGVSDPRIVFQIIQYVSTHHRAINSKNLYRIMRSMSRLEVNNDVLWKRISNRLEDKVGLTYTVDQLNEIRSIFAKFTPGNRRVFGILDLYIRTKLENLKYGPL